MGVGYRKNQNKNNTIFYKNVSHYGGYVYMSYRDTDEYSEHQQTMDALRVAKEERLTAKQNLEQEKHDRATKALELRMAREARLATKDERLATIVREDLQTLKEQMQLSHQLIADLQHRLDEVEEENRLLKEAVCVYGV